MIGRTLRPLMVALLGLALLLTAAPSASAQSNRELQVIDVAVEGDNATMTVVAPEWLREGDIGTGSFLVSVGGRVVEPIVEPVPGSALEVVLVIDTSGSMSGQPIEAAKRAATTFVGRLPDDTRIAVVGFSDTPQVASPFTTDRDAVSAAIAGLNALGETALYDAVVQGASLFSPGSSTLRTMVVLSDGADTVSTGSLGQATSAVRNADVTASAVAIETDEGTTQQLNQITDDRVFSVVELGQLDSVYDDLAGDLQNYFRVTVPAGNASGATDVVIRANDITGNRGRAAEATLSVPFGVQEQVTQEREGEVFRPTDDVVAEVSAPNTVVYDRGPDRLLRLGSMAALIGAMLLWLIPTFLSRGDRPARRRTTNRTLHDTMGFESDASRGRFERMRDNINRRLGGRQAPSVTRALASMLENAGWQVRNLEFLLILGGVGAVAFMLGVFVSLPFGVILAVVAVLLVLVWLVLSTNRRRDAFEDQLNGTLQMLAGALRTGYSLPQAFAFVGSEAPAPTGEEFNRIVVENRLGVDLIEASRNVAQRMQSDDFEWVVEATDISRDVGGDLAEVLDNVAETIRVRGQVKRQVKTLSAEGRISAWVLGLLPFPLLLWQLVVNPEYTKLLFTTGLGLGIFAFSMVILGFGVIWMRRVIRVEF